MIDKKGHKIIELTKKITRSKFASLFEYRICK